MALGYWNVNVWYGQLFVNSYLNINQGKWLLELHPKTVSVRAEWGEKYKGKNISMCGKDQHKALRRELGIWI